MKKVFLLALLYSVTNFAFCQDLDYARLIMVSNPDTSKTSFQLIDFMLTNNGFTYESLYIQKSDGRKFHQWSSNINPLIQVRRYLDNCESTYRFYNASIYTNLKKEILQLNSLYDKKSDTNSLFYTFKSKLGGVFYLAISDNIDELCFVYNFIPK